MADKVEVYLERYSDGVRYEGFTAPPGTPGYTGDANEKYIEATTDGRFRIVVKLRRGFDFMGSPRVRVNYDVDQGTPTVHTLSKNRSQSASPSDRSHRERSLGVIRKFINGQYMNCGLTFGELKSDDDMVLDDHSVAEEADRQGRIVVKLRRGYYSNQRVERRGERSFDPPEHVDTETTHNRVVHKHHVSHALKHVPLRPSNVQPAAPRGYQRKWVRATGEGGKPIVFTLRYRSREALLALGIIDENAPGASSTKTGDTTMSHRSKAQEKAEANFKDRPAVPSAVTNTISSSTRSPSRTLTPGPLLSALMHTDGDDDDDEEAPVKTRSESYDTAEQDFNLSARSALSPTPNQGHGILNPSPPTGPISASSAPPVISLLTDDEEDGQDSNTDEAEHTTFPHFSRDYVRDKSAQGVQESQARNARNRRTKSHHRDDGGSGDGVDELEGEMVGIGYATPPRYGPSDLRPVIAGLTDQERKRAWSEVEQAERELQEEEDEAILASEKRERRKQELMDAKRSFLNRD